MVAQSLAAYQVQDSPLTLRQGLAEYYQRHIGLVQSENCRVEVAQLFQRHDIIHVLFGCSTSLHDETLADIWTIFGSTVKLRDYLSYLKYSETTDVLGDFKVSQIIRELLRSLPDAFRVIRRAGQMSKKWDWANYADDLDTSLKDLRQEYRIQVLAES